MESQDNVPFGTQQTVLPSRDALIELLKEHELLITAYKSDAHVMILRCTLKPDVLPPPKNTGPTIAEIIMMPSPSAARASTNDPNHITVWCTDRQAWRSFRYERLLRVELI